MSDLVLVSILATMYIGTRVLILLPRLDKMLQLEVVNVAPAPLLWELANNAVRPLVYFMFNPALRNGLRNIVTHGILSSCRSNLQQQAHGRVGEEGGVARDPTKFKSQLSSELEKMEGLPVSLTKFELQVSND